MEQCCAIQQSPRAQRRLHGLQLPLHCLQVSGWIVLTITALINFLVLVRIQFYELETVSYIFYGILYMSHILSQVSASLTDPSEKELQKLKIDNLPEFDRRLHAHVIENGRCHLCNIYTSNKKTKHCSLCNKCVYQFDHHCKWLNNCVGRRNYKAFIGCVVTALLISSYTTVLCLVDVVFFISYPDMLSVPAQNYINCTLIETSFSLVEQPTKYCRGSITFFIFLIMFCLSALAISCVLMHLCCFHVYITVIGVSTYEYIVSFSSAEASSRCYTCNSRFCHNNKTSRCPAISMNRIRLNNNCKKKISNNNNQLSEDLQRKQIVKKSVLGNLITSIIHSEIDKAKKIFSIDKNRIHPTVSEDTVVS